MSFRFRGSPRSPQTFRWLSNGFQPLEDRLLLTAQDLFQQDAAPTAALVGDAVPAGSAVQGSVSTAAQTVAAPALTTVAQPVTLYVSTSGNDANAGTSAQPFRTIQMAIDTAQPGDTVMVLAGVYRESIVFHKSGLAGQRITLRGQTASDRTPLAIIDPSIPATSGWVAAPEVGPGVFKTTSLGFSPYVMAINGKQLLRIDDSRMCEAHGTSPWTGFDVLAYPADQIVDTMYGNRPVPFWSSVGGLYGVRDGVTYIRFSNGDDPATMNLEASPVGSGITIQNQGYIVVERLDVRGIDRSVAILGNATHNTIQNCVFTNGTERVYMNGTGSSKPTYNVIQLNTMTLDYYGFDDFGAWEGSGIDQQQLDVRQTTYMNFKYLSGGSGSNDTSISLNWLGSGNVIAYNRISQGLIGIAIRQAANTKIYGNDIRNMSSIGICALENEINTLVYRNTVANGNINFRIHDIGLAGDIGSTLYFYRNSSYEQANTGTHVFYHVVSGYQTNLANGTATNRDIWWYQNSFTGGEEWSTGPTGVVSNVKVLNNIISSAILVYTSVDAIADPHLFEIFDYNWCGGVYWHGVPAFAGPHNILHSGPSADLRFWTDAQSNPDYALLVSGAAVHAGLDLSKSFTYNGKTYRPLPGMPSGYFSGLAPNLGAF